MEIMVVVGWKYYRDYVILVGMRFDEKMRDCQNNNGERVARDLETLEKMDKRRNTFVNAALKKWEDKGDMCNNDVEKEHFSIMHIDL